MATTTKSQQVITKSALGILVPTRITGVVCPDGLTRTLFITGIPENLDSLPCRINVRHQTVSGIASIREGLWVFTPNHNSPNQHLLNGPHEYETTLPPPQKTNTHAPLNPPSGDSLQKLPDDLELYIKLIRSQLAAGQYDTAISTIVALKSAVSDKQKENKKDKPTTTYLSTL